MYEENPTESLEPSSVGVEKLRKNLEEKRERSVSTSRRESVSLVGEEESLRPRDQFGAKVRLDIQFTNHIIHTIHTNLLNNRLWERRMRMKR